MRGCKAGRVYARMLRWDLSVSFSFPFSSLYLCQLRELTWVRRRGAPPFSLLLSSCVVPPSLSFNSPYVLYAFYQAVVDCDGSFTVESGLSLSVSWASLTHSCTNTHTSERTLSQTPRKPFSAYIKQQCMRVCRLSPQYHLLCCLYLLIRVTKVETFSFVSGILNEWLQIEL